MLVVGITGGVGSGKSEALGEFAAFLIDRHASVEGFLAIAGPRAAENQGAESYDLQWLPKGPLLRFADRTEGQPEPYFFHPETQRGVFEWAAARKAVPPGGVVLLDEFGNFEAKGKGHAPIWPDLAESDPDMVVISVRKSVIADIETLMGRPFDVLIDVEQTEPLPKMISLYEEFNDWKRVGVYGAGSGGVEISLGSILHGAKVPLRGIVLSTLQSLVLTAAADGLADRRRVVWASYLSAGLKALSPAGTKVQPMIAITVQGFLYGLGIRVFGWNRLAGFISGFMIGAWAMSQSFLIQWLLLGGSLEKAYDAATKWLAKTFHFGAPTLPVMAGVMILFSALVCGASTAWIWTRLRQRIETDVKLTRWNPTFESQGARTPAAIVSAALRDLIRPTFWVPIVLIVAILGLSGSSNGDLFWTAVRAITIGFALCLVARLFDVRRFINWLRGKGHWGPAIAFERILKRSS